MRPGEELAPLRKEPVTKEQLVTDDDTARRMGLDGVIAHGMLSMGFLGQYVASLAGPARVRRLKARFQAMVRPGDELTCRGVVREVEGGRALLDLWVENQRGERVTTGEAEVETA